MADLIFLIGFSYTGKTSAARAMARRLGWTPLDTDEMVVRKAGKPLSEIFATEGEARFRALEREALQEACRRGNAVISTGGGIVTDPANRRLMAQSGVVIRFDAQPATIHQRLREGERRNPSREARPLLAGDDPLGAIEKLKVSREPFYAEADWTVKTDGLSLRDVVEEALKGYALVKERGERAIAAAGAPADYVVTTETQRYPGYVGWGVLDTLGARMRQAGLSGTAYVIADGAVYGLHGQRAESSLRRAGFTVDHYLVEQGEASKSLASATAIYEWLAQRRAERGHTIVSLGGGMAGDLAGFVAATYLRGMPLVHVPTSLLAMVDAAIGGKVAVNLAVGKNLVGAFYQPRLVLSDVETLQTLPKRELTSGWAEVVKHALILDAGLFAFMLENRERLVALDPHLATEAIKRSAAIKAQVVSEDEKETKGRRILLNYGHTIGHALEAATSFHGLLHGEAVAIGMAAAAHISHRMGMLDATGLEGQRRALTAFGLPQTAPPVDVAAVRQAMSLDKKVSGKAIRWVLLEGIGRCTTRNDVPPAIVEEALQAVLTR